MNATFDGSTFKVLVDAVEAQLADNSVTFKIGKHSLDEHDSPPRVVWVPRGGQIIRPAPRSDVLWKHDDGKDYLAEHIFDNVLRVQTYLWATDYESFERLHNRILNAVHTKFSNASEPGEYGIDTQDARASITDHGHAGTQIFQWRLRCCRFDVHSTDELGTYVPMQALVTIANQTHTCRLVSAGAQFPPED